MLKRLCLILLGLGAVTPVLAASSTVPSLPNASALTGAEQTYCVQSATDANCTVTQVGTEVGAQTLTLTNKTFDTAGTGNSLLINGTAVSAKTGTGSVVLSTSPTLVTPVIGAATGTSLAATTDVTARDFVGTGTPPTLSGSCVVVAGTQSGGNTIGKFAVPAGNCAATTTVILTFALTATNGWACHAADHTTPTSIWDETGALSTTTATFTIRSVTAAAADIITFECFPF